MVHFMYMLAFRHDSIGTSALALGVDGVSKMHWGDEWYELSSMYITKASACSIAMRLQTIKAINAYPTMKQLSIDVDEEMIQVCSDIL